MLVFSVLTLCGLVARCHRFQRTYRLHIQNTSTLKLEAMCSLKPLVTTYKSVRSQKSEDNTMYVIAELIALTAFARYLTR